MRRMIFFLFFLISLGFTISCDHSIHANNDGKNTTDSLDSKRRINLSGTFHPGQYLFYYYRNLHNQDVNAYTIIKTDTSISHDLTTGIPMEVNFHKGPYVIKYILFPGDSINVINKGYHEYHLRSADIIRQNELYYQFVNGPKIDVSMRYSKDNAYDFTSKDLLAQHTYWSKKIKAAQSAKRISDEFAEYHQVILKSKLITNLLYPVYVPNQEQMLAKVDDALIQEHLLLDEKYLGLASYRYALWHYLKFQTLKKDKEITADLLISTANSNFKGGIRDFMLAQTVSELSENGSLLAWTNEYE